MISLEAHMKRNLSKRMREDFALRYALSTETGSACALAAGYSKRNPDQAHVMAHYLLSQKSVQDKVEELRLEARTKAVMTAQQILERLSKIARDGNDPDVIKACRELAQIMHLYQTGVNLAIDKRVLNIQVATEDTRNKLLKILDGIQGRLPDRAERQENVMIEGGDINSELRDRSSEEVNDERRELSRERETQIG